MCTAALDNKLHKTNQHELQPVQLQSCKMCVCNLVCTHTCQCTIQSKGDHTVTNRSNYTEQLFLVYK